MASTKGQKLTASQRADLEQTKRQKMIKAWVAKQKTVDLKEMVRKFNIKIKI